jgi:hypothetical protein
VHESTVYAMQTERCGVELFDMENVGKYSKSHILEMVMSNSGDSEV